MTPLLFAKNPFCAIVKPDKEACDGSKGKFESLL